MNLLNLSFGELLGLAGIVSAGIVALYLLDRTKRRQVVATLRFWTAGKMPEELQHKRRIHQPWSMLLQLLSMLLLLLAIAAPRIGDLGAAHDHVLLLGHAKELDRLRAAAVHPRKHSPLHTLIAAAWSRHHQVPAEKER